MKYKTLVGRDFGSAAETYNTHASFQKKIAYEMFCKMDTMLAGDEVDILDAGCGTGFLKQFITQKELENKYNITECDLAFGMCEFTASAFDSRSYVVNADIENLPFKKQSFNCVFSSMVLQWSEDMLSALNQLIDVTMDDSYVFLSIVSSNSLNELGKSSKKVTGFDHVHSFITIAEVEYILRKLGVVEYSLEEKKHVEYYPDVQSILQYLKAIGARYKPKNTQFIPKKSFLSCLQNVYLNDYSTPLGLPLTWNIITLVIKK